ncbi:MAG: hypothetical protein AAGG11_16010 [Pseudomonadota bacterium]
MSTGLLPFCRFADVVIYSLAMGVFLSLAELGGGGGAKPFVFSDRRLQPLGPSELFFGRQLNFTDYDGLTYFSETDVGGDKLWVTDGTADGTARIPLDATSIEGIEAGGKDLFVVSKTVSSWTLWHAEAS